MGAGFSNTMKCCVGRRSLVSSHRRPVASSSLALNTLAQDREHFRLDIDCIDASFRNLTGHPKAEVTRARTDVGDLRMRRQRHGFHDIVGVFLRDSGSPLQPGRSAMARYLGDLAAKIVFADPVARRRRKRVDASGGIVRLTDDVCRYDQAQRCQDGGPNTESHVVRSENRIG